MSKKLFVISVILITIVLAGSRLASAQEQPPPKPPLDGDRQQMQPRSPRPPDDPVADDMFPPDMIMQHQRELALTDAQKTAMRGEIQRTTNRFNELQWQLQDAMEALHETMKGNQVNEELALTQLAKVLDAEREIKTLNMGMLIRIKNQLTAEQQTKLQTIRNAFQDGQRRDRRPGGPPRPEEPGRRPPGGPEGMRPPPGGLGGPPSGGGPRSGGGRPGGPGF
jgi:Spy/CpxP family protein refolding chaperone